jgi:serine/threonine-protein kinase
VTSRLPYLGLWVVGLGTWSAIFWWLRHRGGPVTFVERQIAHLWAGSVGSAVALYLIEWLLRLPVLTLSPVLAVVSGNIFIAKGGILSGSFYIYGILLYLTAGLMALFPSVGITLFGLVGGACFFVPGLHYHLRRLRAAA